MSNNNHIPSFQKEVADNLFLGSRQGLYTYTDLQQFERFFLQYLFDFDHDFSKPVGFLSESSDIMIFAIAACWKLGIPFVTYNPNAQKRELNRQLEQIEPGLVFTDRKDRNLLDHTNQILISQLELKRVLSLQVEQSFAAKNFTPSTQPDTTFGYFFTSGTSGTPKIVPLKRRQMLFAAKSSARNFRPRSNHFWLLCLPLNHIGGVSIILRSLLYGSAIFRMNRFHTRMVATFLSENKLFQAASLVPTMLKRLLERPGFFVHNNFKAILLGGGPIDLDLIKRSNDRGIPLVPSYGMTETCAQIAANPILKPSGIYGPLKSVGRIFTPNKIQIRDENNQAVGVNTPGEIWLKGPQIFEGYLNAEKTESFDESDWFKTGDYGHLNANGQLFIEARRSDLIITGGENVSPYEVESELKKISPIHEAAVFGLPDKEWGQKVVAVVVARTQQAVNTDALQRELKSRITNFKVPKQIIQADSLPRTDTGKILRDKLTELFEKKM